MRLVITPFACAVIISQLYNSVVTFYFLVVLLDIIRKCYFSSLWYTTGLHNWGHDIIIISYFGKLNEDQSTLQFKQSTPKPVDSETERSDSGIVTTRSQKSHQTAQSRTEGIVLLMLLLS
jgi:hypothetical protein